MGWEDAHLHAFNIGGESYGNPVDDEYGLFGTIDEKRVKLNEVIPGEKSRFSYEYDFGDGWEHTLLVEKIFEPEEGVHYPVCIKGKRACPPEDIGGVWGYEVFLDAISNPDHPEHEEYLEWHGDEFDPEAFDIDQVNRSLAAMGRGASADNYNSEIWTPEVYGEFPIVFIDEEKQFTKDQIEALESLPLRRDMLTLLTYIKNNKVVGTQATGNFPLKAVREITGQFVNPPVLEEQIGAHTYKVRSEIDVQPLYFLHLIAVGQGLIDITPGRRWEIKPEGEAFFGMTASSQVFHMLLTWWTRLNWTIEFPFSGFAYGLPPGFMDKTLELLLKQPVMEDLDYESFARRLIQETGLTWPIEDQSSANQILLGAVENIVMHVMERFGVVTLENRTDKIEGFEFETLHTFKVTSHGRRLLEIILDLPSKRLSWFV